MSGFDRKTPDDYFDFPEKHNKIFDGPWSKNYMMFTSERKKLSPIFENAIINTIKNNDKGKIRKIMKHNISYLSLNWYRIIEPVIKHKTFKIFKHIVKNCDHIHINQMKEVIISKDNIKMFKYIFPKIKNKDTMEIICVNWGSMKCFKYLMEKENKNVIWSYPWYMVSFAEPLFFKMQYCLYPRYVGPFNKFLPRNSTWIIDPKKCIYS